MKKTDTLSSRMLTRKELGLEVIRWRLKSKTIAFTNGVFDILHEGHIAVLSEAATFADILIVGVNDDASVKRLKGDIRPINSLQSRMTVLSSLIMVDAVVPFEEDTPLNLINLVKPDVLIKGGDYSLDTIVGSKEVLAYGGSVQIIPIKEGFSTTSIIEKMKS